MKYVPPPWIVGTRGDRTGRRRTVVVSPDRGNAIVAKVVSGWGGAVRDDEEAATADLIAAAPDLLAVARLMFDALEACIESGLLPVGTEEAAKDAHALARVTLTKAAGGAP